MCTRHWCVITIVGIVEQASVDGKGAAGAMPGTEEQATDDVERGCRDNAFGDKRYLVVGKVAKNHWGDTRDLVTTITKTV